MKPAWQRLAAAAAIAVCNLPVIAAPTCWQPEEEGNGIVVSGPRIVEEESLLKMLDDMNRQLERYQLLDSAKVAAAVGNVSFVQKEVSAFNLQVTELNQVAAGEDRDEGVTPTTPAASGAPTSSLAFTPTPGMAARDLLQEQLALQQNIQTLRLALEGVSTDEFSYRFSGDHQLTAGRRKLVLLGIDLYLDSPEPFENAVAEVAVSLDNLLFKRAESSNDVALIDRIYQDRTQRNLKTDVERLFSRPPEELARLGVDLQMLRELRNDAQGHLSRGTFPIGLSSRSVLALIRMVGKMYGGARPEEPGKSVAEAIEVQLDLVPKIVALLPNKDTYNTARVSNNTKNIGFGAIAGVLNLGANWFRGRETLFLIQEADTLAMRFPNPEQPERPTFGWQIRPTGDRKMVRPGLRQLFALISLPANLTGFGGAIEVETRWRKWNARRASIRSDSTFCERIEKVPLFDADDSTKEGLQLPKIFDISVENPGSGNLALLITGDNFTATSRLLLPEGKSITKANGLKVINETFIVVQASRQSLVEPQRIQLQTGSSIPISLVQPDWKSNFKSSGVKATIAPNPDGLDTYSFKIPWSTITINKPFTHFESDFFVQAGDRIFDTFDENSRLTVKAERLKNDDCIPPAEDSDSLRGCDLTLEISFQLPVNARGKFQDIVLRDLFSRGANASVTIPVDRQNLFSLDKASLMGRTDKEATLAVHGNGFDSNLRLHLGDTELSFDKAKRRSSTFLLFTTDSGFAVAGNKLLGYRLAADGKTVEGPILTVQIDPAPAVNEPVVENPVKIELEESNNTNLVLTGRNFDSIAKITFNGKEVPIVSEEKGTRLVISLDFPGSEVTKNAAAALQFRIILKNGKEIPPLPFSVKAKAKPPA